MFVKDFRKEDRPLERLIEKGPEALSNTELLAIALRRLKITNKGESYGNK